MNKEKKVLGMNRWEFVFMFLFMTFLSTIFGIGAGFLMLLVGETFLGSLFTSFFLSNMISVLLFLMGWIAIRNKSKGVRSKK